MVIRLTKFCYLLFVLLFAQSGLATAEDWQSAKTARWRRLALQSQVPPDLEVSVTHAKESARFAEWVYGTPDSPRVAVAIIPSDDGKTRIFVDRNRDRRIEERDLTTHVGDVFFSKLDAQQVDGDDLIDYSRDVAIRIRSGSKYVEVATLTKPNHSVADSENEDGKPLKVQQVDVDANGQFADGRDLIQIDVNRDGKFNAFLETFPFRPVMKISGKRLFVKADRFGRRMNFESATKTGKLKVSATGNSGTDKIQDLSLSLTGDDGSVYTVTGRDKSVDLPVGQYIASVLYVTLQPEGDNAWTFTFSADGKRRKKINVRDGKETVFDPIGQLSLDVKVEKRDRKTGQLSIQPRLFTESGLLINLCEQDGVSSWSGSRCQIEVTDANDNPVGQSSSGFA